MPSGVMSSPESPVRLNSPMAYVHPRLTERGSYVQRWKALRDRNRNLPKLDFNTQIAASLQVGILYHRTNSSHYLRFILVILFNQLVVFNNGKILIKFDA